MRGRSKKAPKQKMTRSAEPTAELSQRASSSGWATTTAAGECRAGLASAGVGHEAVIEALELCGLQVNIEASLDERTTFRTHSMPSCRIGEQLADAAGERVRVALRDQIPRVTVDHALGYAAHPGTDRRYAGGRRFQQHQTQPLHPSGGRTDAGQHQHRRFAHPGKHIRMAQRTEKPHAVLQAK